MVNPPAPVAAAPGTEKAADSSFTIADKAFVAATLLSPHNVLSLPLYGMIEADRGANKINNEGGRLAVKVAMSPLWIPAAVLATPALIVGSIADAIN